MKTISWKRFQAALKNKERVLITSHVNPDGDALGSELAAAELVASFGCKAKIYNVSPTPGNLTFLALADFSAVFEPAFFLYQ